MPYKDPEKARKAKRKWAKQQRQGSTLVEPKGVEPRKVEPNVEPVEPKNRTRVEPVEPMSEKFVRFGDRLAKIEGLLKQHKERLETLEELLQDYQTKITPVKPKEKYTRIELDELPFSKKRQAEGKLGQ